MQRNIGGRDADRAQLEVGLSLVLATVGAVGLGATCAIVGLSQGTSLLVMGFALLMCVPGQVLLALRSRAKAD